MTTTSVVLLTIICSTLSFWVGAICLDVENEKNWLPDFLVNLCKFVTVTVTLAGIGALGYAAIRGIFL